MKYFLYKFIPYIPNIKSTEEKPNVAFVKKIRQLKTNHILIGFAGRFVEEKGYDILFQAIPTVIKKIPNSLFIFAGQKDVDYEPFFSRHQQKYQSVKNCVVFLGLLTNNDLTYYYQNLDLFVISSRSDCFPLTQMEAAKSRVPIVVTDIPGARILVQNTQFGQIVKSNDSQSLADGIINTYQQREKYIKNYNKVNQFLEKYAQFKINR